MYMGDWECARRLAVTLPARIGCDNLHGGNDEAAARRRLCAVVGGALLFSDVDHLESFRSSSWHVNLAVCRFIDCDQVDPRSDWLGQQDTGRANQ